MGRRRALIGVAKGRLPAEYEELKYIQCNEKQFIQLNAATIARPCFHLGFSLTLLSTWGQYMIDAVDYKCNARSAGNGGWIAVNGKSYVGFYHLTLTLTMT